MASKTYTTTCGYNGHYMLYLSVTENRQDIANNRTNVTVKMYAQSDSSSYGAYNLDSDNAVKLSVNGSQVVSTSIAMDFRNRSVVNMASWTGDIAHNADGTKNLSCSGTFNISGSSYLTGGNISGNMTLTTIPRASQPSCITWPDNTQNVGDLGSTITIHMNKKANFTHTVRYAWDSMNGTIATGVLDNCTWKIPLELANRIPNATKGTGVIYVDTYNGNTLIGTKSCMFTCTVPQNIVPVISAVNISENASLQVKDVFVQNKSSIKVLSSQNGAYKSTIRTVNHTISRVNITINNGESFTPNIHGDINVKTVVTDSRGRIAIKNTTIVVQEYFMPQITMLSGYRCTSDGTRDSNGECVNITATFKIASVSNNNENKYSIEYKAKNADEWNTLIQGNTY